MSSSAVIISDATPLIVLAKIGQLKLLKSLFGTVYIPQAVYDEVVVKGAGRDGSNEVIQAGWIIIEQAKDQDQVSFLRMQIDPGEAEAIVLAREMNADLLLLDERKARNLATQLGFDIVGTAGILVLFKQNGLIGMVRPFLDDLIENGFRLSQNVYNETLRQAEEL